MNSGKRIELCECVCVFLFSFVVVFDHPKKERIISTGAAAAAATAGGKQQIMPTKQRTWKYTLTIGDGDGEIDGHQRYIGWLAGLAAVRHLHTEA